MTASLPYLAPTFQYAEDRLGKHDVTVPPKLFRLIKVPARALVFSFATLEDIAEAKGKQELYTRQAPQILKALRDTAIIQSAESSNRIEGVTVDRDRLKPLVLGNARPRDRSEEEVMG